MGRTPRDAAQMIKSPGTKAISCDNLITDSWGENIISETGVILSHSAIENDLHKIQILSNPVAIFFEGVDIQFNPVFSVWQIKIVQIDIQQIDIPGVFGIIQNVGFNNFSGYRQCGILWIIFDIFVFCIEQFVLCFN